ncbi:Lcl C-terminal domain-containing protein [Facilibium subflavum]|uniref:Lcl C-terminal domain-containing protein n=1 Tax=Facilibium subflavum TaxID=2219058 RepID=UPI000E64ADB0|nr:DUF1566 domain-containing protein [Facilibium subflavum]
MKQLYKKCKKPLLILSLIGLSSGYNYTFAAVAPLLQTGQTATTPLDPAPAGSDGAVQAGKALPQDRFQPALDIDGNLCNDALVDTATGLMWAKNGTIGFKDANNDLLTQPDYANTTASLNWLSWDDALTAVSNMNNATTKLCGYSDWHLPNRNEALTLSDFSKTSIAAALNNQGFNNMQDGNYWTNSAYAVLTADAWSFQTVDSGFPITINKTEMKSSLPVRGPVGR